MSIAWKGIPEFQKQMATLRTGTPKQIGRALKEEADRIMLISKDEVPWDTTNLKHSGLVDDFPTFAPGKVYIEMGYGNTAVPYALAIHELYTTWKGAPRSWLNAATVTLKRGKPRFLADPVNNAAAGFGQRIAAKIRRMV